MNWLRRFLGRSPEPAPAPAATEAHSVMLGDETRPLVRGHNGWIEKPEARHITPPTPQPEQVDQRDKLYAVIRESMMRAGVLSSAYKFKVLALDRKGQRFLVMVDISREAGGDGSRLSEIEALIAQTAKSLHGLLVPSVYWRTHEHVAVGAPQRAAPAKPQVRPSIRPTVVAKAPDAISEDEVAAFKRALAGGAAAAAQSGASAMPNVAPSPLPSRPVPLSEFDLADQESRPVGLGSTQYGDLM